MKKTISRDVPLAEITLRRYEKPENLNGRDLIRKFCLSLGLLQPGDSRDIIVDIFNIFLKNKKELTIDEIIGLVVKEREKYNLPLIGIASSNISRQLKRLRDILLIQKVNNNYRLTENLKLMEIFEEKIEKFLFNPIKERVKEYIRKVEEI